MTTFASWSDACAALLARECAVATFPAGGVMRTTDYRGALVAAGYDKAKAKGLLDDYKRLVLGIVA